jgi:ubiquinone/menaquinone biosynthesis C-methylase UbiE
MPHAHHGDIERFDQWAASYDRTPGQLLFRHIHRSVIDAVLAGGRAPRRVVDVGCGTGRLLEILLPRLPAAELVGVDPSPGMLAMARARFAAEPRVRLEIGSADRLPLESGSADVVTTTLSFHHWEGQGPGLREVGRVLAPGGRLLLADVLGIGLVGRLLRPVSHHRIGFRDAAELTALLREAGFGSWRHRRLFGPAVPVFLVEARRPGGR